MVLALVILAAIRFNSVRRDKVALEAQQKALDGTIVKRSQLLIEQAKQAELPKPPPGTPGVNLGVTNLKPVNYPVPFTPQAPFAVWDERDKEACEEASVVMAAFYFQGRALNAQIADEEINKLVEWQKQNLGEWKSTTAEQTAKMANKFYGLKTRVIYDFTIDDIKKELAAGNLLLIPSAGRKLGNPYYKQPGPIYHMLAIRGFDDKFIFTNDPGTKRGENYKYYPDIILQAAADWPGSNDAILEGKTRKAAIAIDK